MSSRVRRGLPIALGVLLLTDLVGGLLDIAAGRTSLTTAWGPAATLCAPLPMIIFQVLAVVTVLRAPRRPARVAAALLALACLVSVASGFADGQLARADLRAPEVAFQVWLLLVTAVLGALAVAAVVRPPRAPRSSGLRSRTTVDAR